MTRSPKPLKDWLARGGPGTWLRASGQLPQEPMGGPRLPGALTVRECLRSGAPAGTEGAIAGYGADLGLWAEDIAHGCAAGRRPAEALRRRLERLLGAEDRTRLDALWSEAVRMLARPARLRAFADLDLAVVPRSLRALAGEAAHCVLRARHPWWRLGPDLRCRPLLILYGPDGDWSETDGPPPRVVAVELWTQDTLPETLAPESGLVFRTVPGAPYEKYRLTLDLPDAPEDPERLARRVDRLLSALFCRLLADGRPLRHFGCTLLCPFDAGSRRDSEVLARALGESPYATPWSYPQDEGPEHGARGRTTADERQSMQYFLPEMRQLLYPASEAREAVDGLAPLAEWRLQSCDSDRLTVHRQAPELGPIEGRLRSVKLLRYFNGTYLLALRVTPRAADDLECETDPYAACLGSDGDDWWKALAFAGPSALAIVRSLQLTHWLAWTKLARILYRTFAEQAAEDKINPLELVLCGGRPVRAFDAPVMADEGSPPGPTEWRTVVGGLPPESGPRIAARSEIVRALLGRFFASPEGEPSARVGAILDALPLRDARFFVNVAYGLSGPPAAPETMRRLFALALFVDRPEDAFDACDGYAYDPDWLKASLADCSLGLWDATGFYSGATGYSNAHLGAGAFFCEIAGPRHVPQMYERMLVQALFYRSSLRLYSQRISEATGILSDESARLRQGAAAFRELRLGFISFTNRYWFHELTPQLQGKALFALQQRGLELEREYGLVKEELERSDEYLSAARTEWLTGWAIWVAVIALWIALLPVVPVDGSPEGPVWTLDAAWIYLRRLGELVCVIAVLAGGTWLLLKLVPWVLQRLRGSRRAG